MHLPVMIEEKQDAKPAVMVNDIVDMYPGS